MSLTLDSRFPICILLQSLATFSDLAFIFWPHAPLLVKSISYQIQPFPSRSFKGSHKKISLIFKDAAISCSFCSCFVACFLQPNCPTASSHQTINIFRVSPRPSAFFGCPKLYKHTGTKFDLNLHASFTNLGVWLSSSQMVSHRMERCAFQFDHCS